MKVKEVIEKILAYHPSLNEREADSVDTLKCGDPEMEVHGIVTTCAPTFELCQKVGGMDGYNMIICHEPLFYSHKDNTDWLINDEVYQAKIKLLNDNGIAVWRDHDHLHRHNPDGIYTGVMNELGWEKYRIDEPGTKRPALFEIPETTVKELAAALKAKLEIDLTRVIGNRDGKVTRVYYKGGGNFGNDEYEISKIMMEKDVNVVIAGELIDWTAAAYCRDAAFLGQDRAVIHLGHMNSEDLGMKHYPTWLKGLLGGEIPVTFVRSGDPYRYI